MTNGLLEITTKVVKCPSTVKSRKQRDGQTFWVQTNEDSGILGSDSVPQRWKLSQSLEKTIALLVLLCRET